jgi:hypothetical protein
VKTKIVFILVLILSMIQGINAQEEKENQRIGFAGASVILSPVGEVGGGVELGTFKKGVGVGIQIEYIPALNNYSESFTFVRLLLPIRVTNHFFIKVAGGVEARDFGNPENWSNANFLSAGVGAMFPFEKVYLGFQPNLVYSYEGIFLSTVSFTIGIKFN